MPQVILDLCDPCFTAESRDNPTGSKHVVALDGNKTLMVILCEKCEGELLKPLADVLGRWGSPVTASDTAPAVARQQWTCPVGDCPALFQTEHGLRAHARRVHSMTLRQARGLPRGVQGPKPAAQMPVPAVPLQNQSPDGRLPCPYPGCGSDFKNLQTLVGHFGSAKHGSWGAFRNAYPELGLPSMNDTNRHLSSWDEIRAFSGASQPTPEGSDA